MPLQPTASEIEQEKETLRDIRRRSVAQNTTSLGTIDPDLPSPSPTNHGADPDEPDPDLPLADPSHLFWVPAHVHPELAPGEFKAFLKDHAQLARAKSARLASTSTSGAATTSDGASLGRKKSMLSRQYSPSQLNDENEDVKPKPHPRRRSTLRAGAGAEMTLEQLQNLEELAEEASKSDDPTALRSVLRRSLSLNVPSLADSPDLPSDDAPILPATQRPAQILRRAARTKIRKPSMTGDGERRVGGRETFKATSRRGTAPAASPPMPGEKEREREMDVDAPLAPAAPRPEALKEGERPQSYSEEVGIYDSYSYSHSPPLDETFDQPQITDEPTSFLDREPSPPLDLSLSIGDSKPPLQSAQQPGPPSFRVSGPTPPSSIDKMPAFMAIHQPSPQRPTSPPSQQLLQPSQPQLHVPPSQASPSRTPSPPSSSGHSQQSQQYSGPGSGSFQAAAPQKKKEEKEKKGLFGFGKKSKDKDKDKDKDRAVSGGHAYASSVDSLSSVASSSQGPVPVQHQPQQQQPQQPSPPSPPQERDKESGFFSSLFSSKKKNASSAAQPQQPRVQSPPPTSMPIDQKSPGQSPNSSSLNINISLFPGGGYARYPIHVERAVYRLSHIKLANPRRPLLEQVLISNLMFWYLGVINRTGNEKDNGGKENGNAEQGGGEKGAVMVVVDDAEDDPAPAEREREREERERERERQERERLERERLERERFEREREEAAQMQAQQQKKEGRRGSLTKTNGIPAGARRAEMPVRGPQYDVQSRGIEVEMRDREYESNGGVPYHLPSSHRGISPPPHHQQQQPPPQVQDYSQQFVYSPPEPQQYPHMQQSHQAPPHMNGLPPGAMQPGQQQPWSSPAGYGMGMPSMMMGMNMNMNMRAGPLLQQQQLMYPAPPNSAPSGSFNHTSPPQDDGNAYRDARDSKHRSAPPSHSPPGSDRSSSPPPNQVQGSLPAGARRPSLGFGGPPTHQVGGAPSGNKLQGRSLSATAVLPSPSPSINTNVSSPPRGDKNNAASPTRLKKKSSAQRPTSQEDEDLPLAVWQERNRRR